MGEERKQQQQQQHMILSGMAMGRSLIHYDTKFPPHAHTYIQRNIISDVMKRTYTVALAGPVRSYNTCEAIGEFSDTVMTTVTFEVF